MNMESETISKGTLIDGRYEIREKLGQGGMGMVYRALDKKLNQMVALKMLLHNGGSERSKEERRRRFMHEIYAINEVEHRNVVHIQEFGFFKDTPYMVIELLKGKDLNRILKEATSLLPIDYCVDVMLIVSAAIQACHDRKVIHRDLKPGNIMVIESDSGHGWDVKVVDFSISKVASDLTKEGQIVGTPNYLSPEQINGQVVPASDQYALGLLLYVCLTNRHPFEGLDGLPLIRAIERGEVKKPRSLRPDIPEELEEIILRAMHLDPAQRFSSVHEFGRKIWPFGSQLGQGVWKKYYFETPMGQRLLKDSNRSVTNMPLVLQIAEGKVPMSAATALAHYQSVTSVKGGTTTVDDPAIRTGAEADSGGPTGSARTLHDPEARPFAPLAPSAPSGWRWESSSGDQPSAPRAGDQSDRKGLQARSVVLLGLGMAVLVLGVFVGNRLFHRPLPVVQTAPAAVVYEQTRGAPSVQAVTVAKPLAAVAPAALPRAEAPKATETGPAAPDVKSAERGHRTQQGEHERGRRKSPKAGSWATDPAGNPIPPM